MKKLIQLLSLLLTCTVLITACGDDDDDDDNNDDNNDDVTPAGQTIDINDPVEVSQQIMVSNATEVDGNPPAPSTDALAPEIEDDDD